jgi:hypothetical protein
VGVFLDPIWDPMDGLTVPVRSKTFSKTLEYLSSNIPHDNVEDGMGGRSSLLKFQKDNFSMVERVVRTIGGVDVENFVSDFVYDSPPTQLILV